MSSDRALQSFCRRKYSPLFSFQKRVRHIRGVCFRNLCLPPECCSVRVELRDLKGSVIAEGQTLDPQPDLCWRNLDITSSHASKAVLVVLLADNQPLLEWTIYLTGLVFVSRHLPDCTVSFCPDSLLLVLSEGVYCDVACFAVLEHGAGVPAQNQLSSSCSTQPFGSFAEDETMREDQNCSGELTNRADSPSPKTPPKKNGPSGDSASVQDQRPKVYVKAAALCDVREKIFVDHRRLRKSYGVNALNRLSTMERAIRHTTSMARTLQTSLEGTLSNRTESLSYRVRCELESARLRVRALSYYVQERGSLLANETKLLERDEEAVVATRARIEKYVSRIISVRKTVRGLREDLQESKVQLENVGLFKRQVALICELDEYIYPIRQIPSGAGFTICSALVQSLEELKDPKKRADDLNISTGMGYVFHLVCMLSVFTGIPLIYPLKYDRNSPVIVDVSIDSFHQKELPLWVKGKDRLYFEHAVSLLARNVAHLRVHFGQPSMRGRIMPGLFHLMNFFKKKRVNGVSYVSDLSGGNTTSVAFSEATVSDSNLSSRCATPDLHASFQGSTPRHSPRLKHRVHSSVPNLISTPTESLFDEVDKGAASDTVS